MHLQGTDSWKTFLKKLGKKPKSKDSEVKGKLKKMTLSELKLLAKRHKITVKGTIEKGFFEDSRIPPSKAQYVTALSKKLSEKDIS